jgi:hypothetical protein
MDSVRAVLLQRQSAAGHPQSGQILPVPVE